MKILRLLPILVAPLLLSCAAGQKTPEKSAPVIAPAAPADSASLPDSISGRVSSDDEVVGVPLRTEVRLMFEREEVGRQKVDAQGNFRFEGPFNRGRYELKVQVGALSGTRAFTYPGGEMKNVSVVIAKKEPRRHKRRHRRRN